MSTVERRPVEGDAEAQATAATTAQAPAEAPRADGGNGRDAASSGALPTATAPRPVDPRAVRVALAPSLGHVDLAPLVVEPEPIPLQAVPSVIGVGILGGQVPAPGAAGAALAPPAGPAGSVAPVLVDGTRTEAALTHQDADRATLRVGPSASRVILEPEEPAADGRGVTRREVIVDGWRVELELESERRAALRDRARRGREESARGGPTEVHAIIPGRIVSVSVAPGDEVVAGQQLLVVEAMKMQNELHAPRDGTVSRVGVAPGDTIEIGDLLLVLE